MYALEMSVSKSFIRQLQIISLYLSPFTFQQPPLFLRKICGVLISAHLPTPSSQLLFKPSRTQMPRVSSSCEPNCRLRPYGKPVRLGAHAQAFVHVHLYARPRASARAGTHTHTHYTSISCLLQPTIKVVMETVLGKSSEASNSITSQYSTKLSVLQGT